jgi:hypothetical protein
MARRLHSCGTMVAMHTLWSFRCPLVQDQRGGSTASYVFVAALVGLAGLGGLSHFGSAANTAIGGEGSEGVAVSQQAGGGAPVTVADPGASSPGGTIGDPNAITVSSLAAVEPGEAGTIGGPAVPPRVKKSGGKGEGGCSGFLGCLASAAGAVGSAAGSFGVGFVKGLASSVVGAVQGVVYLVNPYNWDDVAKGLAYAANPANWDELATAIGDAGMEFIGAITSGDFEKMGEAFGQVTGQVLMTMAGGGLANAGKLALVAKLPRVAQMLTKVPLVSKLVTNADEAANLAGLVSGKFVENVVPALKYTGNQMLDLTKQVVTHPGQALKEVAGGVKDMAGTVKDAVLHPIKTAGDIKAALNTRTPDIAAPRTDRPRAGEPSPWAPPADAELPRTTMPARQPRRNPLPEHLPEARLTPWEADDIVAHAVNPDAVNPPGTGSTKTLPGEGGCAINARSVNCFKVTESVNASLEGGSASALPKFDMTSDVGGGIIDTPYLARQVDMNGSYFENLGAVGDSVPISGGEVGKRQLAAVVESWGPGGKGTVAVKWDGGGGHIYNAANVDGRVVLIEGQVRIPASDMYNRFDRVTGAHVQRTQDMPVEIHEALLRRIESNPKELAVLHPSGLKVEDLVNERVPYGTYNAAIPEPLQVDANGVLKEKIAARPERADDLIEAAATGRTTFSHQELANMELQQRSSFGLSGDAPASGYYIDLSQRNGRVLSMGEPEIRELAERAGATLVDRGNGIVSVEFDPNVTYTQAMTREDIGVAGALHHGELATKADGTVIISLPAEHVDYATTFVGREAHTNPRTGDHVVILDGGTVGHRQATPPPTAHNGAKASTGGLAPRPDRRSQRINQPVR